MKKAKKKKYQMYEKTFELRGTVGKAKAK